MSETWIFVIGIAIFALTIYGAVVARGLAMQSVEHEQNPRIYGDDGAPLPTDRS